MADLLFLEPLANLNIIGAGNVTNVGEGATAGDIIQAINSQIDNSTNIDNSIDNSQNNDVVINGGEGGVNLTGVQFGGVGNSNLVDQSVTTTEISTNIDNSWTDNSTNISNVFTSITNTSITETLTFTEMTSLSNSPVITDSNLINSFSSIIDKAARGGNANAFADPETPAEDNVVKFTPELSSSSAQGGARLLDGNDKAECSDAGDVVNGNKGDDLIIGGKGKDFLRGGQDQDRLDGGDETDIVNGNKGDDIVRGGAGDDMTRGGGGNDYLYGNEGGDILVGDKGIDTMTGGDGSDKFVCQPGITEPGEYDIVTDYDPSQGDQITCDETNISNIAVADIDANQDGAGDIAICGDNNQIYMIVLNQSSDTFNIGNIAAIDPATDPTLSTIG